MPNISIPGSIRRLAIIAVIAVVIVVAALLTASFWVNWWWFDSIGYRGSLMTRYLSFLGYGVVGGLLCAAFFGGNLTLALRRTRDQASTGIVTKASNLLLTLVLVGGSVVVAVLTGSWFSSRWEMFQLARFVDNYGLNDPVFNRDMSFYLLRLPALSALLDLAIVLVFLTAVATLFVYVIRLSVRWARIQSTPAQMRVHVLALAGVCVILIGIRYILTNYQLVYSERGAVFGAGYTDVNVQRWTNYALVVISLAVGGLLLVNAFIRQVRPLLIGIAAWAVVSFLLGVLIPVVVQQVFVEPGELRRERPFIVNNIAMTREGFGLSEVTERELSGTAPLEANALEAYPETLNNIRLWDYRIARTTFQQLQSFVPYYVFLDVDVDRYQTDGGIQQVLVSARELELSGLPSGAQTWTNTHLVYTHGYAGVVSPVSQATAQGLPIFVVERIPPTGEGPYQIDQPEIYFGENEMPWIAVNSNQPEFSGEISLEPGADTGFIYDGEAHGSVSGGGFVTKLLLAVHFRDQNLFFTGEFNSETRVIFDQQIGKRISTIAPFLTLDEDPYLVILDGRLFWIVDAYTTSNRFPHATRFDGVNYQRNGVKVVVDAYNGNVDFYRTAVVDPVADAYDDAYGGIFKPVSEAPEGLASHFRYPEALFELQSAAYAEFHVSDPTAFYNGEDRWTVPRDGADEDVGPMEPYYVTLTLPDEDEASFALIRPFIPGGGTDRQNMTSWMAGVSDESGISRLVAYRFPRQETVFGPAQISARIDQEPDISAQISLWNQSGSEVLRGNLLVIPVGESILYVQPLYLEARGSSGSLPEMKRVIVASSERVVMRTTLPEALIALTADIPQVTLPGTEEEGAVPQPTDVVLDLATLAEQAVAAYERGQQALVEGDWQAYGESQMELERILLSMSDLQAPDVESEATPTSE